MTNPMLAELDERLASLKGDLAALAKFAPAPGVLCAPTMEMGIGWKAKALLPKIEAAHTTLADMAKRLEAAERDAARYQIIERAGSVSWDVRKDGEVTAYIRNRAPAKGESKGAAIDAATQEGEG